MCFLLAFILVILFLLKNNKLRKAMSKRSVEIASKNFNGEKITEDLIKIYAKL